MIQIIRWYERAEYVKLRHLLRKATEGTPELSALIFRALGGAWRDEDVSKQGGGTIREPYWRDGRPMSFGGQAFSRSVDDTARELHVRGLDWGLYANRPFGDPDRDTHGLARVECPADKSMSYAAHAATPALALTAALIGYILGHGLEPDASEIDAP